MTPLDAILSYGIGISANLTTEKLKAILPSNLFARLSKPFATQKDLTEVLGAVKGNIEAYGGSEYLDIQGALLTALNRVVLDAQSGRLTVDKSLVQGATLDVNASEGSFHLNESVLRTHSGTGIMMGQGCSIVGGKGTSLKMS